MWLVADTSVFKLLTRGENRTVRCLGPVELGLPMEVLPQGDGGCAAPVDDVASEDAKTGAGRIVSFFAAREFESSFESPFPPGAKSARPHGLLTYTLVQVFAQSADRLTYRDLARRLQQRYVYEGYNSPTPFVEGAADGEVFGIGELPPREPWMLLARASSGLSMRARFME